jgi:hypothetical protein
MLPEPPEPARFRPRKSPTVMREPLELLRLVGVGLGQAEALLVSPNPSSAAPMPRTMYFMVASLSLSPSTA